jgi:hypothetical protein
MLTFEQESEMVKECALALTLGANRLKQGGQPMFLPNQLQNWRNAFAGIQTGDLASVSDEVKQALEANRELFNWIENPSVSIDRLKALEWKEIANKLRAWHFKHYSGFSE